MRRGCARGDDDEKVDEVAGDAATSVAAIAADVDGSVVADGIAGAAAVAT